MVIQKEVLEVKYYVVAEVREDYPSLLDSAKTYNDYVSRKSMLDFCSTLSNAGFDCSFFGGTKKLFSSYQTGMDISNVIFINYNYGLPSSFKRSQSPVILELMGAKYSGSNPFVSLLVNDKEFTKKVLRSVGIQTPNSILWFRSGSALSSLIKANIPLPLVVKPNCEGSSLGITADSLCDTYEDAAEMVRRLMPQYHEVIIEQYIPGYECTVWLIGNPGHFNLVAPLLVSAQGNSFFSHSIFTMKDKANHVRNYSLPELTLGQDLVFRLKTLSERIFVELGLRDYARLDFRIATDKIYFIEANALPIFSKTSEIGKISQLYDIPYAQICQMVIEAANTRLMAETN